MAITADHADLKTAAKPSQNLRLKSTLACQVFMGWYRTNGHWVYDTRADAARTWIERGIVGRAPAPEGAEILLADWIAADPAPALIARLRAQETAARGAQ